MNTPTLNKTPAGREIAAMLSGLTKKNNVLIAESKKQVNIIAGMNERIRLQRERIRELERKVETQNALIAILKIEVEEIQEPPY